MESFRFVSHLNIPLYYIILIKNLKYKKQNFNKVILFSKNVQFT